VIGLIALLLILPAAPAHAYLDPGSGSMLFQGLLAAIAAGLGALKLFWPKVRAYAFFWRRRSPEA
jgi:hypothetical protein